MLQLEIPVMNFEPPCRDVEGRLLLTPTTTPYSLSNLFSALFRARGYRHALGRLVTTFLVKKQVILFELTVSLRSCNLTPAFHPQCGTEEPRNFGANFFSAASMRRPENQEVYALISPHATIAREALNPFIDARQNAGSFQ